ncbi:MAG: sugar phosphate nucleotidyltransferase [Desulfuromonadaceae bacterium]|nr:sugar phosphate nucleotidyltransferase [Desulfuromonadaceae bacterium]MDD2854082.1 sugar phosphate nucleotidyltransferase [Desulfuromonadaceae bacterium]
MYIVILAGGSGTRFWPLSRVALPKQLISITGDSSMLQRTVERVLPLQPERILIITNQLQAAETERQMSSYNAVPIDVISEPVGRNTAPAIALAASIIASHDSSGIMAVLPADHFIKDEKALCSTLINAAESAKKGYLVTLGILPSRPETGYGYIEADMELTGVGPFPVKRFIEKPPLDDALRYLAEGSFFWNSGMFVWGAETILREMETHIPELPTAMNRMHFGDDVWNFSDIGKQIADVYESIPGISIDYAVMEKSENVLMLPADMGWSDVGSWSALPEIIEPDPSGIVSINTDGFVNIDSSDCLVYSDKRIVAAVGVHNLVIVSTSDAILVCDRERCQDVKQVVEQIGVLGLAKYL